MNTQQRQEREKVSGRRRAETHKTGFDRTAVLLPDGRKSFNLDSASTKRIAVIPYRVGKGNPYAEEGSLHFERTYFTHRGIGANEDSYVCLAKTAKQRCPVCEYRAKLAKDPDADENVVKSLAPKERQLWNILDLEDLDSGVQLWDISFHLFGKRLDEEVKNADEDEGYEFFSDPIDGCILKLGVNEKSFNGNKFYEVVTIGFKHRKEPLDGELLTQAMCLDKLIILPDYDKLKAIFLQTDADGGKEEQPEEKPTGRRESAKTKPADDDDDWSDSPKKTTAKKESQKEDEPVKEVKPAKTETKAEPKGLECPACEGGGKSSKGNECRPCHGTGYLETDDGPAVKKEAPAEKAAPKTKAADDDDWDDPKPAKTEAKKTESKVAAKAAAVADDDDWG